MREKNILVISDTHGRSDAIQAVIAKLPFRPAMLLFLGDGLRDFNILDRSLTDGIDIYKVAGNVDIYSFDEPTERMVDVDGCRILMMHGNLYSVEYGQGRAIRRAAELGADVLLFGHTHKCCSYTVSASEMGSTKSLIVGNPGSLGEPRDRMERSYGLLTVRDGKALFSHGFLD